MSNRTPTEEDHSVIFRELNISAEIKRLWGTQWNSPELAYEFGDRKFYLRTEDAGIYTGASPGLGNNLLDESGDPLLDETSGNLIDERSGP
jgi:hypothetical protein